MQRAHKNSDVNEQSFKSTKKGSWYVGQKIRILVVRSKYGYIVLFVFESGENTVVVCGVPFCEIRVQERDLFMLTCSSRFLSHFIYFLESLIIFSNFRQVINLL